ncbi:MAG: hypothetical protein U0174_16800 [Polyangiaceae bacterium]
MKNILALSLLGLAGLSSVGCMSRSVTSFEDHQRHPVTAMEAVRTNTYLFSKTYTHEFFNCQEKGDTLVCKPLCGSKTDLQCPAYTPGSGGGSTNVR